MSENYLENTVTELENYIATTSESSNTETIEPINGVYYVSQFGTISEGADASTIINNAIAHVVDYGGKLVFDGTSYSISSPIMICPPSKNDNDTKICNFELDFNYIPITVSHTNTSKTFNVPTGIPETMIYVNAGFANEERIGIIRNVNLEPGYYQNDSENIPCIETGMYLYASSHISYKDINIMDATRGVYIAQNDNNIEVFMDEIKISKSLNESGISVLRLTTDELNNIKSNKYPYETKTFNAGTDAAITIEECKYVGFDCRNSDSHFSNIIVEDYLVGIRCLGGNNRIKDAVVKNEHSPEQRKYSVGFINGSGNYYIDCRVNDGDCIAKKFYIGWMSQYAVPFFLNNCKWYGEDISTESYAFFIAPDHYSGGGIYANSNCNMKGPSTTGESPVKFCNVDDYDINYSGTKTNIKTKEGEST